MIKLEQTPVFQKALRKVFVKLRVRPRYTLQGKLYGMCSRDITALNDYLSTASDQDLKELYNNQLIIDVVEDFKIHLVKSLVLEVGLKKRAIEQEKKNLQAQKEYQAEQEKRLHQQQENQKPLPQMQSNFITQLKLTTEQKEILKKMVNAQ